MSYDRRSFRKTTLRYSPVVDSEDDVQEVDVVEHMMQNNMCDDHGFHHLKPGDVTIDSIESSYDNILMRFTVEGVSRYGRLRSNVCIDKKNNFYRYAFEMSEECPYGFNNVNNGTFECCDRRGVLLPAATICCQLTTKHDTLEVFSNKMVDEDCVCCVCSIDNLTRWPSLMIGDKIILVNSHFAGFIGICKWKGKINGIECIGAEMTDWVSNECNGFCLERKIFDCRNGHGMLLRCRDIEIEKINPHEFVFNSNGFVDPKCIYHAKKSVIKAKEILQIGRRAKFMHIEKISHTASSYSNIFGVVRWFGTINKGTCVGIELDHPCEGGIDGTINCHESFTCESGYGAVLPVEAVSFDQHVYDVTFTVEETFNVDYNFSYKEDWDQSIVQERNLKLNTNIFVYIEKHDRILSLKGTIRWCGYIKCVSVVILNLTDSCPFTPQQRISQIMNNVIPSSHIIVHTQYLFRYRQLKSYERMEDTLINVDLTKTTEFGWFRWRGVDIKNHIYYGFEMESPSENGSDGTFYGQKLFQCKPGHGVLIPLQIIRQSIKLKRSESLSIPFEEREEPEEPEEPAEPEDLKLTESAITLDDKSSLLNLVISIMNNDKISTKEVVSSATKVQDPRILRILVDHMTPSININEFPELIDELVKLGCFETLSRLIDKCALDDTSNKVFLRVASDFLRKEHYKYFERCMDKCTNKNMEMDNGETFVTHIIKEKVDQRLILAAIKDYEFDLTKPNTAGEEPLTLACGNMMMEVMGGIMKYIKEQEARKKACVICMDREIDTVFNCGHNSCEQCSYNIDFCPICKVEIESTEKLYFR